MEALEVRWMPSTYVVDTTKDLTTIQTGEISFRQAVTAAMSNNASSNVIDFAAALKGQTIQLSNTLHIDSGANVRRNLTINGNGDTIRGGQTGSVLEVDDSTVTLSGLVITGGSATTTGGGLCAQAESTVTLTNCTVSGNSAVVGGGIGALDSQLTLDNCQIVDNTAADGGGIAGQQGSATINQSIISGNTAQSGNRAAGPAGANGAVGRNGAAGGIGMSAQGAAGGGILDGFTSLQIFDTTLDGNRALGGNGGSGGNGGPAEAARPTWIVSPAMAEAAEAAGTAAMPWAAPLIRKATPSWSLRAARSRAIR